MMSKDQLAKKLSDETGFQVTWVKNCFHLWDGEHAWFPLYTSQDVRRKADNITQERKYRIFNAESDPATDS